MTCRALQVELDEIIEELAGHFVAGSIDVTIRVTDSTAVVNAGSSIALVESSSSRTSPRGPIRKRVNLPTLKTTCERNAPSL